MPGIDECLLTVMALPGARGAAVVDWTSGLPLGTIGAAVSGDHEATAADTAELARMAAEQLTLTAPDDTADTATGADVGAGSGTGVAQPADTAAREAPPVTLPVEDVIVTARDGYHLLRYVETAFDSSVLLHLWLDRREGNLALARLRLGELARALVLD
ncbi:hypothetical protein JJV70_01305 [Streptomyces sp. JJ66]|uniref:hypothetical protein n=1 Tax=Streptomyces sp. JJ66 TaxID=2803843 RepID=UPI001C574D8F|nr:hypothetical protein [Streptomyces sp. JJ66]MBW1600765.1 hypothetical protein [Streptomyces sp. JJ66]